jgi:hypothetical protein
VLGYDLDVLVAFATVALLIFDAQVGKVHLVIEVREFVLACPFANLLVGPIRMSVVVGAPSVPLVQPALVLPLELVVEKHSVDAGAAFGQAFCGAFVGAINLEVVFTLSLAIEAMPERLAVTVVTVTVVFEKAFAFSCECDRMLAGAGQTNRLNQSLLAQMAQVT